MFFQSAPGGLVFSQELCVLFNGVQVGDFKSDASTLFATRQTLFQVVHSQFVFFPGFSHFQTTGPDPANFEAHWVGYLQTQPLPTVEQVLRQSVRPDLTLELAALKTWKVETSSFSRGFYWKQHGNWTWDCFVIRTTDGAEVLERFLNGEIQPQAGAAPHAGPPMPAPGSPLMVRWTDGQVYPATVSGPADGGLMVHFGNGHPQYVPWSAIQQGG